MALRTHTIKEFFTTSPGLAACTPASAVAAELIGRENYETFGLSPGLEAVLHSSEINQDKSRVTVEEIGFASVIRELHLEFIPPMSPSTARTMFNLVGDDVPLLEGYLIIQTPRQSSEILARFSLNIGTKQSPMHLTIKRKKPKRIPLISPSLNALESARQEILTESALLVTASSFASALSIYSKIIQLDTRLTATLNTTLELYKDAIDFLAGPARLAGGQFPNTLSDDYQNRIKRLRSFVRDFLITASENMNSRLNMAPGKVVHVKFVPKEGILTVDCTDAVPSTNLTGADVSKLTWEVAFGTSVPGREPDIGKAFLRAEALSSVTTKGTVHRRDPESTMNLQVWVRARYRDPERSLDIASLNYATAEIFTLDAEFVTRFSTAFTLSGKPSVVLSGSKVSVDWTSVMPTEAVIKAFQQLGVINWKVVFTSTDDLAEKNAPYSLLPITSSRISREDMTYKTIKTLHIFLSAVLDPQIPNIPTFISPWATQTAKQAISDTLGPGESLSRDQFLVSYTPGTAPSENTLILQQDGNFVLYHAYAGQDKKAAWSTRTAGYVVRIAMQADGKLMMMRDLYGTMISTSINKGGERSNSSLVLLGNGNAILVAPDGQVAWSTNTIRAELTPLSEPGHHAITDFQDKGSSLKTGSSLQPGERLASPNDAFWLILQDDRNLVLYRMNPGPRVAIWQSDTAHYRPIKLALQDDGNLVLCGYGPVGCWSSGTGREGGRRECVLKVQDDGNVVLMEGATVLWRTNTAG